MVARGEHGADGAEDYDGEDGDDDAAWWWDCQWVVFACRALVWIPCIILLLLGVLATYHVHALKAETTGFMVAGCAVPYRTDVGMGSRGWRWAGRWLWVVRGVGVDITEVLLRRIEVVRVVLNGRSVAVVSM